MIGIYQIKSTTSNQFYIGSSQNIKIRWSQHKSYLNNDKHPNQKLQNAWDKYGEENFVFEIIKECSIEDLIALEQDYIDQLNPHYNLREIASSNRGIKIEDTAKMQQAAKKRGEAYSVQVILYDLSGRFQRVCSSFTQAIDYCQVKNTSAITSALKSKSGKCGVCIVKPYEENYLLQITPYQRTINFSIDGLSKKIEASRRTHTGKVVTEKTRNLQSQARKAFIIKNT